MRDLWRIALWGLSATAALTLVAYAGTTEPGRDRLHVAVAEIHEILIPSGAKPIRPLDAREGRRLAETVRVLAADRGCSTASPPLSKILTALPARLPGSKRP
jgi:hypothetical protein